MLWPALSHLYGLHPWDVDRLTATEVAVYRRSVEAELAAIDRANTQ